MQTITAKKELQTLLETHSGWVLVTFWKRGCPGCMKVSKLLPLLENHGLPIVVFDCTDGMEEAKAFGMKGTPQWVLYDHGEKTAEINPAADRDELYRFLTGRGGVSLLRPVFEMALDEGEVYAGQMQDAVAEIMFRSRDDGNGILAAARLKILKACVETPADNVDECLDAQIARCIERLRERLEQPDGETEARRFAISSLPSLRDELLTELTSVRQKK